MQAAQYNEFSVDKNTDVLFLKKIDKPPAPKPGQVIVKIHAASLNPCDVTVRFSAKHNDEFLNLQTIINRA